MNIRDGMKKQLEDLATHLEETSQLDVTQLGSEWDGGGRKEALRRNAVFLRTFIIPDVPENGQRIAPLVVPERPNTEMLSEESSVGPAFLAPQRPGELKSSAEVR